MRLYIILLQKDFEVMKASVMIPMHNAGKTLRSCLEALREAMPADAELLAVDDYSTDNSYAIAAEYADRIYRFESHRGRAAARNAAIEMAHGEILIFVDSDVIVRKESLNLIIEFFCNHPEVSAVTGVLSKEHPNPDFLSQYKNLYMHYTFMRAPEDIRFLYGSIHALRKEIVKKYDTTLSLTDDTALGQDLFRAGKVIKLLKTLQVVHLKKCEWFSLIRNDFQVPYDWACIFIEKQGWLQLGKGGTGFAHAPKEQLLAIMAASLCSLAGVFSLWRPAVFEVLLVLLPVWFLLTLKFHWFLKRERGFVFFLKALPWTFFDHLVMAAGITAGLLTGQFVKK